MEIGDKVVRRSYGKDIIFTIIDIYDEDGKRKYLLKGLNIRIEADSDEDDLELSNNGEKDKVFNKKVNTTLKKVLLARNGNAATFRYPEIDIERRDKKNSSLKKNELFFGRPGKILHIDGDPVYLEICLKTYKQLNIDAVGRVIAEKEQPSKILDLVKEVNPDIVVITGHDGMMKNASDYMDLNNYRNSKYFVECVSLLRSYKSNYDDLVIFAGACQSNYEALLDAGANFASSPNRVLIHCLDPVFICEKVAYTNINEIVNIEDAIENTITGIKGVGGLQTRGKYREGYPKSQYYNNSIMV
ncbi:MAG: sporulation peptidase YabG [Clostridium sp.]|uniref:sporulation peptidase YabG n=1 Tax=Clostridium culturomicium TaxID=1499683 RepID=UPI00058B60F1|nr:sporulation peptidase YabG [Clostridium culturomicium]MDU4892377.1 sporulation peptidase YabG [Clostridium sp.]MDU7085751.1 sporulation peptidase YabG [Clostridium sp.]